MSDPDAPMAPPSESAAYTANVYLVQTRPWLMFVGAVGVLGAILLLLSGLGIGLVGLVGGGLENGAPMGAVGLVYAGMGVAYGIPPVLLIRQAVAITDVATGGFDAVNEVLRLQRNFWRFVGAYTILVLVLWLGVLVVFGGAMALYGSV